MPELGDVKFVCVWCKKEKDEATSSPCSAPDGNGHLVERHEYAEIGGERDFYSTASINFAIHGGKTVARKSHRFSL